MGWVKSAAHPYSKAKFAFSFHGYEPENGETFKLEEILFVDFVLTDFGHGIKAYWTYHVIAQEPNRGRLYNEQKQKQN